MTITTPPQETRPRRPRRDDVPAPARPPRRRTPPPDAGEDTAAGAPRRPAKAAPARTGEAKKKGAKKPAGRSGDVAVKTGAQRRSATTVTSPPKPTAKPATKPAAKPAAKPAPKRPRTRTVAMPRRSAAPPRAPFVLLVVGLLGGALVSLLLLNTVLAQDAFTLSELQRGNQRLNERKQALQEDINRENSPAVLHAKARGLGMVDGRRPAFIDARTGRITQGGARPPGVSDEVMAAAAAAGVAGAPGGIVPPTAGAGASRGGAPRGTTPRAGTPRSGAPRSATPGGTAGGTR
jgi:hypothetical protein